MKKKIVVELIASWRKLSNWNKTNLQFSFKTI